MIECNKWERCTNNHMCNLCANEIKIKTEKFITQLNTILKDNFDYVSLDTTLKVAKALMERGWVEV